MNTPNRGTAILVLDPGLAALVVTIGGHRHVYGVYWDDQTSPQPGADRLMNSSEQCERIGAWTITDAGWTATVQALR